MSLFREVYNEFNASIKSRDTEEKLDLIFYRPFGFLIAKLANLLKMTPSQLSVLGLVSAIMASTLYGKYFQERDVLIIASIFFLLSGIFDSSDGQLARLQGSGSKIGLMIDGLCDAGATISIYIGVFWFLYTTNPYYGAVVAIAALSHSYQCAILDFYHREYLYFGYGITNRDYWNPTISEIDELINKTSGFEKFTNIMRRNWVKQQTMLSVRSDQIRYQMRTIVTGDDIAKKERLCHAYKKANLPMLTFWRLIGTNAHTIIIILAILSAKREVILFFDLIIFNLIIFIGRSIQKRCDNTLLKEIELA